MFRKVLPHITVWSTYSDEVKKSIDFLVTSLKSLHTVMRDNTSLVVENGIKKKIVSLSDIFLFLDFLLIHFIGGRLILLPMVNYEPNNIHGHMDIYSVTYS